MAVEACDCSCSLQPVTLWLFHFRCVCVDLLHHLLLVACHPRYVTVLNDDKSYLVAVASAFHMCPWKYFSAELNNLSLLQFSTVAGQVVDLAVSTLLVVVVVTDGVMTSESKSPILQVLSRNEFVSISKIVTMVKCFSEVRLMLCTFLGEICYKFHS